MWWCTLVVINKMLIGHMSIIYDLLSMCNIYSMADACAYMHTLY